MRVVFTKHFTRAAKKLSLSLRPEVEEKISFFLEDPHHPALKTHKLGGSLKNFWSFSVNSKIRIIFEYLGDGAVVFHSIGDHSIYD